MPAIDMMVNNILANPSSSGTCGVVTTVCIIGYLNWNGLTAQVPTNTIAQREPSWTEPNRRATTWRKVHCFRAGRRIHRQPLAAVKGTSGFGSNFYNKNVKQQESQPIGDPSPGNGTATATLDGLHAQAPPAPTDPGSTPTYPLALSLLRNPS